MPTQFPLRLFRQVHWQIVLLTLFYCNATATIAQDEATRLIDLPPFDRITLKPTAGGEILDTVLLDLPNRKVPTPLPTEGELELRRLVDPSVRYSLPWTSIAKIELYEQLILGKARQLTEANAFAEAYAYIKFLNKNYPNLRGLSTTIEKYLKRDAFHSFSEKRYDDSISILSALYDFNPQHKGLAAAVDTVINRTVKSHLDDRNFTTALSVLDAADATFPELHLKSVAVWRKKFEGGAKRQLLAAQHHLDKAEYQEARQALRRATAILPTAPRVAEMFAEINRRSPQVTVGVTQHGLALSNTTLADMAALRVSRLTNPKLIEMIDFGPEGGIYSSKWATFSSDDTGLEFDIQLQANAVKAGILPEVLTLQILNATKSSSPNYQPILSGLLKSVAIQDGQRIHLQWKHPHVRPEALFPIPVQSLLNYSTSVEAYKPVPNKADKDLLRFTPRYASAEGNNRPSIVEQIFTSEEFALTALLHGDIDLLDRIAPWQIDRLRNVKHITVSNYRLPTVHVLLPNQSKPLLRRREFRRALCYGIDRQKIVNEIILGGKTQPGFRVLSGPLPAGSSIADPLGYGYKPEIVPRTYEPRLAAVLATVARESLKQHLKRNTPETADPETTLPPADNSQTDDTKVEPLILIHPPNFVAQATCQAIKRQLEAVGIPIKLQQISPYLTEAIVDYDLRYAELAIWEPLIDMQQLLGTQGIAGNCSPSMSLALHAVDQARNWQESRTRLRDLHDVAFYDLPVVPLWQTINSFAYRKSLQGIGKAPISLYQDVAKWRITNLGAEQ
ncbi:MAG: hypothetical protein GXP26_11410 [Planctomycetes bacterium]|nr:hypothetical protein [Planctomycetota bacterium]